MDDTEDTPPVHDFYRGHLTKKIDEIRANSENFTSLYLSYQYAAIFNDRTIMNEFVTALMHHNTHIQYLHLSSTLSECTKFVRYIFFDKVLGATTHPSLKVVDLGENKLNNDDVGRIAKSLQTNQSLIQLDLRGNYITADGCRSLADVVLGNGDNNNNSLEVLNLADNNIGVEGCRFLLAPALTNNNNKKCSLKSLNLSRTGLGVDGAKLVAKEGGIMETLYELQIDGNNILDDGMVAIAVSIQRTSSLCRLFLGGSNGITNTGASALEASMKHQNYSLEVVELDDVGVGVVTSDQRHRIHQLCIENRRIKRLFDRMNDNLSTIPFSLWPRALELVQVKPDLLFLLLQEKPDLCRQQQEHQRNPRRRSRPFP